jgi:hypothetical protein
MMSACAKSQKAQSATKERITAPTDPSEASGREVTG